MPKKARFTNHIGLQFEQPAEGRSRCLLQVQDLHRNGTGVVHGGVLFTLADTAMGAALYSTLEDGEICATIESKIGYFKPVFDGELVCTGETISRGKTVAAMEASIHLDGVLVAKASGSFAIFKRKTDAAIAHPSEFA
jgi:acyl-CoA thioesterase